MKLIREPLIFAPVYKDYLWGGDRIAAQFSRENTPDICAESWEISAHPDGMSLVAAGKFKGSSLDDLTRQFGADLVGTKSSQSNQFPLLFKIIDAKNKLSVQVHPNNGNAALTGGQPKTEMWYVLDCVPGASLYAGLAADATATSVAAASRAGSVADQLVELSVQPGQALFIPGGLVHAIGDGCLIYEVQQNSNTTYRMFDWNRTDGAGKPRELHIEASLTSIDWTLKPPAMVTPSIAEHSTDASWSNVVSCEFFTMKKLDLTGTAEIKQDGSTFTALFAVSGSVLIRCDEGRFELAKGSSALLPAAPGSYSIDAITPAALLITTL